MIPGIQWALDKMQAELDGLRKQLAALQGETTSSPAAEVLKAPAKRGRPPGAKNRKRKVVNNWWAQFTPEERSAEMKRRFKARTRNKRNGGPVVRMEKIA